jgi:xanthine dehydrogenase small subunit
VRDHILFYLNGVQQRVTGSDVFQTLSRHLRYGQRQTGTKIVCEEGDCGACTVLIGRRENGRMEYRPINSCIQFLFQLDCAHVVTVEGLSREGLTPLQESMVSCQGAQCGYCTPGFIMAMAAMYEKPSGATAVSAAEVREALTGNLCRCTGYEPIIKAALEVQKQPQIEKLYPSLQMLGHFERAEREPVSVLNFFKPADIESAVKFKADNPGCVIVQGATDYGVWCTKRGYEAKAVLSLNGIAGLADTRVADGRLEIGGRVSLARFEEFVADKVPQLAEIMDRFGSPQIKNAGTLAGNIANASPIADSLPFLYVTNAGLELTGLNGARVVPIDAFYVGYKKLDLREDEIITRIFIPLPSSKETLRLYKVSKRSHLDISSFTAAMLMTRSGERIDGIRIAYGGVGPMILRLPRTEAFLAGKPFSIGSLEDAGTIAREEITPLTDVRGSRDFRLQLAENVLRRFYYEVSAGQA